VTPRVPPVAASVTMEKSAMQIADAVAVIDIAPAGHMTTSVGATECECTGGKRGSGESKGDCKSNHGLTQRDLPFARIVVNTYDRALRNRFIDIAAIWACLRQFFCGRGAPWSRPSFHARKAMDVRIAAEGPIQQNSLLISLLAGNLGWETSSIRAASTTMRSRAIRVFLISAGHRDVPTRGQDAARDSVRMQQRRVSM
jgi:hypothetical protein